MAESILTSTKKNLGLDESYTAFDADILMYINGVFSTLDQLGIGPEGGFAIEDDTATWDDFLGTDLKLNSVKTYVTLQVKLLFDPPQTAHHLEAVNHQIKELEWRLNTVREMTAWVAPVV